MRLLIGLVFLLLPGCKGICQPGWQPDTCNTMLWGVVNHHGDTSWLFGTYHEFGNSFLKSHPEIQKHKLASTIVLESVFDKIDKQLLVSNWAKTMSQYERRNVRQYLKRHNVGYKLKHVKHLPPSWVAYSLLSELVRNRCSIMTKDDVVLLDEGFANYSLSHGKTLIGLESPLDSLGIIRTMMTGEAGNDSDGVEMVKGIVFHEERYWSNVDSQCWEADCYRRFRICYHFGRQSQTDDPDYSLFLDRRNDMWLPKIEAIIDSVNAFIAVGLKHLFYQKGLILQLRNAGYHVFPVELERKVSL